MSESILSRPRESSEERTGATAVRDAVRARRARGAWLWGLALAVVVGGCGASAGTQRPWQRVTTPSFEVLGQVEEQTVTALAIQLETFRQVAMALTHTSASPATLPTRVLVFANDDALKAFSGQRQAVGMYSSSDRQRVLILSGENRHFSALEILCHEYVHLLLERSSVSYPSWYEEGLAEFLSTTEVRDGKARLGRPPARYGLRSMQQGRSAPTGSHIQLDLNGESGDDWPAWKKLAQFDLES